MFNGRSTIIRVLGEKIPNLEQPCFLRGVFIEKYVSWIFLYIVMVLLRVSSYSGIKSSDIKTYSGLNKFCSTSKLRDKRECFSCRYNTFSPSQFALSSCTWHSFESFEAYETDLRSTSFLEVLCSLRRGQTLIWNIGTTWYMVLKTPFQFIILFRTIMFLNCQHIQ